MIILLETDNNISGDDKLAQYVDDVVKESLSRFSEQLTRVSVHLSDENSTQKSGSNDKRCLMEARLAGLQPVSVSHQAETVEQAIDGAIGNLKRSLANTLGRLNDR